MDIYWKTWTIW